VFGFAGHDKFVFSSEVSAAALRRYRRRRRAPLVGLLCGLLLAALNVAPSPAIAGDAKSCLSAITPPDPDDYGQIEGFEGGSGASRQSDARGEMTDIRVVNADNEHCQYIASIHILPATGGAFEFGYLIGWWGSSDCQNVDKNHYYESPTLFNVRVTSSGHVSCEFYPGSHPTQQSYKTFQIQD